MPRFIAIAIVVSALQSVSLAEETFVSIQKVVGNRMLVVDESGSGRGRGRGGSEQSGATQSGSPRGRGRARFSGGSLATSSQPIVVTVPANAKITSAMRERRTFEFRVGSELAGGLRNRIFQNMKEPLPARIVTAGNRITEINVITDQTDINQSTTDASGQTVVAVRPKRPLMKRRQ